MQSWLISSVNNTESSRVSKSSPPGHMLTQAQAWRVNTWVHSLFGWSSDFPELPPNVSVCFCTRPRRTWPTGIKAHTGVGTALGPVHCIMLVNACSVRKVEELACSLSLENIGFTWWLDANARNRGSSKTGMSFAKVYTLFVFINCCCWNF